MLSLSLPSHVDAQLFQLVSSGKNVTDVIRLLDAGARLDIPFSLDYEIKRGQTTRITLTTIEALFVGWDLVSLSQVVAHMGVLPDVVFPNISSALHQVHYAKEDLYCSWDHSSEKKLLFGLLNMLKNSNYWTTPFFAPSMWECIAHKDLEKEQHLDLRTVAHIFRNLPKISDPTSLDRVTHIPKSNKVKFGTVLCAKMGVHEDLHHSKEYQYLTEKTLQHILEPQIVSCLLEWEIQSQSQTQKAAPKTHKKM